MDPSWWAEGSTLDIVLDAASAVCLVVGSLMSLAAGLGLLRFPDLLSRMHAATKPQVLGLLLVLLAVGLQLRSWAVFPLLLLAWLLQLITAPVSAHMVGRAGYRTKHLKRETLVLDDLDAVVERAAQAERELKPKPATGPRAPGGSTATHAPRPRAGEAAPAGESSGGSAGD